jgi:hypothetical protein
MITTDGHGSESGHEVMPPGAIHDGHQYPGSTNGSGCVEPGEPAADDQYALEVVCCWTVLSHVGGFSRALRVGSDLVRPCWLLRLRGRPISGDQPEQGAGGNRTSSSALDRAIGRSVAGEPRTRGDAGMLLPQRRFSN